MKQIRVIHVMGHMRGGGVETTVMNHYRHIDRNKIQFDFLVDSDSTSVPIDEIESLGGHVIVVPPYKRLFQYMDACEGVFNKLKPDIVHSNLNTLSVFPLEAARKANIPVRIAHSHSTANPGEYSKTMIKYFLRNFSTIEPTHLAACSEYSGRWLFGKRAMDGGRVHIIKNAIDVEQFSYNPVIRNEQRSRFGIDRSSLVVGHVGRMCYQKNQLFCLDVFAQLLKKHEDAKMIFAGNGEMLQTVKRKAHELGIAQSVLFLGARSDVQDLYQSFDALLFPSKYEGLPLTLIEAQASGLPIVISKNISKEAVQIKPISFSVDLSDPIKTWSDTLETALKLGSASRKSGCQELVKNGYRIQDSAESLCKWYQQILSRDA